MNHTVDAMDYVGNHHKPRASAIGRRCFL